jgi:hypothetical protein
MVLFLVRGDESMLVGWSAAVCVFSAPSKVHLVREMPLQYNTRNRASGIRCCNGLVSKLGRMALLEAIGGLKMEEVSWTNVWSALNPG